MSLISKETLLMHLQRAEMASDVNLPIEFFRDLIYQAMPRPWVGLTEEETIDLAVKVGARLDLPHATKMQLRQQFIDALRKPDSLWMLFARDIEAKLKELNT